MEIDYPIDTPQLYGSGAALPLATGDGIAISDITFIPSASYLTSESLDGQTQVLRTPGARWEGRIKFNPMRRAQMEKWRSFFNRLQGRTGTFILPVYPSPQNTATPGHVLLFGGYPAVDNMKLLGRGFGVSNKFTIQPRFLDNVSGEEKITGWSLIGGNGSTISNNRLDYPVGLVTQMFRLSFEDTAVPVTKYNRNLQVYDDGVLQRIAVEAGAYYFMNDGKSYIIHEAYWNRLTKKMTFSVKGHDELQLPHGEWALSDLQGPQHFPQETGIITTSVSENFLYDGQITTTDYREFYDTGHGFLKNKGGSISPGGFRDSEGTYREFNLVTDATTAWNRTRYFAFRTLPRIRLSMARLYNYRLGGVAFSGEEFNVEDGGELQIISPTPQQRIDEITAPLINSSVGDQVSFQILGEPNVITTYTFDRDKPLPVSVSVTLTCCYAETATLEFVLAGTIFDNQETHGGQLGFSNGLILRLSDAELTMGLGTVDRFKWPTTAITGFTNPFTYISHTGTINLKDSEDVEFSHDGILGPAATAPLGARFEVFGKTHEIIGSTFEPEETIIKFSPAFDVVPPDQAAGTPLNFSTPKIIARLAGAAPQITKVEGDLFQIDSVEWQEAK